ncbi:hypothetical protein INT45_001674 [Circinella minor]|uniref:Uncharacterized protein n=1 Tax=Circinella minor TaxID=1195481 RepID=A0A8H7S681_9FUNG|nr:hypothetical protein INT45_001674 [Circinella minor]
MSEEQPSSYKEIIKQLAAQAPKPYGDIPPLLKKRRKKNSGRHQKGMGTQGKSRQRKHGQQKRQQQKSSASPPDPEQQKPMRRMSHVEDWIVVDSKESLPDEEELIRKSPFQSFLSADFLTQVLPLHMPPPSLSATPSEPIAIPGRPTTTGLRENDLAQVQTVDEADDEDLEDDEGLEEDLDEEEDDEVQVIPRHHTRLKGGRRMHPNWKSDGEEEDEDDDDDDDIDDDELSIKSAALTDNEKSLVRRHSISSFSKAQTPSTWTTKKPILSSSPPQQSNTHQVRWVQTIAQLRRSLVLSSSVSSPVSSTITPSKPTKPTKKEGLIPMPPAPRRPASQRRRSEATTQPRFNPDTNTYTRDTRSNPDHLRIISSELNMIRARKLLSPLKPRGFLPRRKDPFVRGERRRESNLRYEFL